MSNRQTFIRYIKGLTKLIKSGWLIIGLCLALLIALETVVQTALYFRDSPRTKLIDILKRADGYQNEMWVEDSLRELLEIKLGWEPYVYWRTQPFDGEYINVDDDGLRFTLSMEVATRNSTPPLKIFVFGGSTTWGYGARDENTIPSLLVKTLSQQGVSVEITNFGQIGYVSSQEVIELILQLKQGNIPDIVIFYDGVNDTFSAFQNGLAGIPENEINRHVEFNISQLEQHSELTNLYFINSLRQTGLFRVANKLAKILQLSTSNENLLSYTNAQSKKIQNIEEGIEDAYLANLEIVASLSETYNFTPIFYWQPTIYNKENLTEFEEEWLEISINPVGPDVQNYYEGNYSRVGRNDERFSDITFYNISEIFKASEEPRFIDFNHLTEEGNQEIAERMAADITTIYPRP
ncbi:MAG: SGNH/GDSL hydrolase family protein [Chloroflexi bacterium]|nr:SGNH/GDSL hydrolase family protein [Chloroflexota bacterium]